MNINIDKSEKLYLYNNQLVSTSIDIKTGSVGKNVFYEVIRVIDGVPLFFNEHIDRLKASTQLSGVNCLNTDILKNDIISLLKANPIAEKNLKITFYCTESESTPNVFAYFIDSHYPSVNAYEYGVKVELLPMQRHNPNVKLENPTLRGSADKAICLSQTHEVLLVNNEGFITEGSRSNFFAVYGNTLVTPPSNQVLEGITRMMVIKLAKENKIAFSERTIHSSEIEKMDGAFITGTSSKVLPIAKVGHHEFKTIPIITRELMALYDNLVNKRIQTDKILTQF
jgi:branched-chain amino acid aminotransferase